MVYPVCLIRSTDFSQWAGLQVHTLALRALLHPRATSAPAQVQRVFLQAALKVFAQAALSCGPASLADLVGVARECLPAFTQSQLVEVQERASSFRQLLAALHILPLDWEKSTEQEGEPGGGGGGGVWAGLGGGKLGAKERQLLERLELPVLSRSSVRAVDEAGAREALQRGPLLRALTAEAAYPVHPKAQRRVPVPEGLLRVGVRIT
ncbi:hypothetical protein B484DRAFT_403524 [Ochromonadaceae sp. CCMP2298]|nr:hypothetical protein B484DRAFT_403524 [Ochromonadaceae sp. CCMP2298]